MVKILLFRRHHFVIFPRLRNTYHNGKRKRHSVHYKEFKRVVKHCRIRTCHIYGRKNFAHFFCAEYRRTQRFFACKHSVRISAYCIYFTVMSNKAVRVGTLPAWICIRTEPRMDKRHRRNVIFRLQIFVERAQLFYKEHSLVHNRTRRKGSNICIQVRMFKLAAQNVKFSVKRKSFFNFCRAFDKALHNARHTVFCTLTKNILIYRNCTPAKKFHSLFFCKDFKHFHCLRTDVLVLRKKEHSYAVIAFVTKLYAGFCCSFLKKSM